MGRKSARRGEGLIISTTSWTRTRLCSGEFYKFSSPTTSFTLSMHLDLTMHYFVTFGTGWFGHSPALPSSWQWWQQAASWQVEPQLGLLGLSSSLSTSTDSFSSHRKLLISTGATQLSHAGLAIPIGIAIYDLCSKCNIWPRFWPQNNLIMQLCIACVLLGDPKACQKWARSVKNWVPEGQKHTYIRTYPNSFI